jgi:tetratricopeptide (TPR) repeat protein
MFALHHAGTLLWVGSLLQQAKQPAAALRLARQAAALYSPLAVYPSNNPGFLHYLSSCLVDCSALANHLGEPAFALQQAESGRRIAAEWIRTAPADLHPHEVLTIAWQRIAKAHWGLGERDQALAAFRESAVIDKRLFERQPSSRVYLVNLSKSYDRLVFYGSQAGDLRGAAAAILERSKLWPGNAKQLTKSADDFDVLAKQVTARTRGPLSREDQAEQDHYLAESCRLHQAAEAARRRVGHDSRAVR